MTQYYSYSPQPPVAGKQSLDDIRKFDCTLYVPLKSKAAYQSAPQWKDFFYIEEVESADINELSVSPSDRTEVYNLNGVKVSDSTENLPKGVYLVRRRGTTTKLLID